MNPGATSDGGQRDRALCEAFVRGSYAELYRWFLRLSGTQDEASDLTQETFAAFLRSSGPAQENVSPRTWLFAVGRNVWRKQLRDRKETESISPDLLGFRERSPERSAQDREFRAAADQAVSQLPADLREAFILRFWNEFSYEEIGTIQGVSAGVVRWRYFAARRRLHQALAIWEPERGGPRRINMHDDEFDNEEPLELSSLEHRLLLLADAPIPDGLLDRCLATIPEPAPSSASRLWHGTRWRIRVAGLAAAAVLVMGLGLWGRPRQADAAHLLSAVKAAWTKVPASHRLEKRQGSAGTYLEETWFVRGRGYRQEIRKEGRLIGIVVANPRWKFQWDVPGRIVAAWSSALAGEQFRPDLNGLVLESEAMLRWAETHHAEIRVSSDTIGGRPARMMVLHWPGPGGDGSLAQTTTVWFDPESLLPIRERQDLGDGLVVEESLDYPDPSAVPNDLLTFRPPRDVTLEINDPDLGRQVYSEGQPRSGQADVLTPKGTER